MLTEKINDFRRKFKDLGLNVFDSSAELLSPGRKTKIHDIRKLFDEFVTEYHGAQEVRVHLPTPIDFLRSEYLN